MAKVKRVRTAKFKAFGDQLAEWRGNRDISEVLRRVRAMGIPLSPGTLRGWEYGWTGSPDPVRLLALASVYGVEVDSVLAALLQSRDASGVVRIPPTPATELPTNVTGFTAVPLAAGRIAAGEPLVIEDAELLGSLAFREEFIAKRGHPICVRVGPREESMVPVVMPGDVVLLECDPKKIQAIRDDRIYAVRLDGGAMLKRLELVKERGAAWLACSSDNPDKSRYKTRLLPVGEGQSWLDYIIGEVVWRGQYIGGKR